MHFYTCIAQSLIKDNNVDNSIDNVVKPLFKEDGPGAVILVSKKGEIIYHKAFGMSNLELNTDTNLNTVYRIASNTKPFTAVAVLKLCEQGELSLEDPITKFIKDYPVYGNNIIQVKHLLSHTSGIKNYNELNNFNKELEYSHETFINLFKHEDMDFSPGSDFKYSNSGYYILGYIIELVTGKTYSEYLNDTFFKPLGMTNTRVDDVHAIIPGRAEGYYQENYGFSKSNYMGNTFSSTPAGGILSTASDIHKWYKALYNGEIISESYLKKATQFYNLTNGEKARTGFAWFLGALNDSLFITHDGSDLGFYSSLVYYPKQDVFVVMLTNCNWVNGGEYINIPHRLAGILLDIDYYANYISNKYITDFKKIEGLYTSQTNENLILFSNNNELYIQSNDGRQSRLFEIEKNIFYSESNYYTLTWLKGSENLKSQVVIYDGDKRSFDWMSHINKKTD